MVLGHSAILLTYWYGATLRSDVRIPELGHSAKLLAYWYVGSVVNSGGGLKKLGDNFLSPYKTIKSAKTITTTLPSVVRKRHNALNARNGLYFVCGE